MFTLAKHRSGGGNATEGNKSAIFALAMGLQILLRHSPKLLDEAEDVSIYFSGHTHGR